MADYEIEELARFEWMQSRIPALDALVHFVPDGPRDAAASVGHESFAHSLPHLYQGGGGGDGDAAVRAARRMDSAV